MSKMVLQRLFLILGVIGLVVVLVDLVISIAATFPGTRRPCDGWPLSPRRQFVYQPCERGLRLSICGCPNASGRWVTDLSYLFSSRQGGRCDPHTSNVSRRSERAQWDTGCGRDYRQGSMDLTSHGEWCCGTRRCERPDYSSSPSTHSCLARLDDRIRPVLCVGCVLCDATVSQ